MKRYMVSVKLGISAESKKEAREKIAKVLAGKMLKKGTTYVSFGNKKSFSKVRVQEILF